METYESVKSNPVQPEKKEKKKGGAWKGIVAVILAAGVVGSTTISAFNLVTLKSYIAEQKKEENPETTEDYVKIADNYEIKPTTNISDAYKSGDTSKLTDKEKETLDMAKKAIKDMKITDSMSDFEKEKAVYDWMTKKLQHDVRADAFDAVPWNDKIVPPPEAPRKPRGAWDDDGADVPAGDLHLHVRNKSQPSPVADADDFLALQLGESH